MSRPLTSVDPTADPEPTTKKRKIASTSDSQTTTDVVTTSETKSPSRKEYSVAEASVQTSLPDADADASPPSGTSDTSHHEVSAILFEEVLLLDDTSLKGLDEAAEAVVKKSSYYYNVQELGQLVQPDYDSDSSAEQPVNPAVAVLKGIIDTIRESIPSTSSQKAPYTIKCVDSSPFVQASAPHHPPSITAVFHSEESERDQNYDYGGVAFLVDPEGADFENKLEGEIGSDAGSERSGNHPEVEDLRADPSNDPQESSNRNSLRPPAELLRCATETMSGLGNRRHVLGISVAGNQARFWYFDRAGSVRTPKLSMHETTFIRMVMGLFLGSSSQLGFEESIQPKDPSHPPEFDFSDEFNITVQGTVFSIQRPIHVAHELSGRGTVIFAATPAAPPDDNNDKSLISTPSDPLLPSEVVVKLSWQRKDWGSEDELYRLAQKKGVKGVAQLYRSQVLSRLSFGYRGKLLSPGAYCDRELRVQVSGPLCIPLHDVHDPKTFQQAVISLVEAHHDLYHQAGILHHDISVNNLMVDANDHSVGVLIDLDIAIHVRDGEKKLSFPPAPGGTYAFRAIDILRQGEPVTKVFYRHDLESFMYSLMWIVTHYIAPDQEDRFDLMAWDQEDPKGAASSKEGVIIGLAGEISSWPLTDGWFPRMARLFKEGRRRQFRATQDGRDIDEETYGGFITFESFRAILDDYHS